MRKLILKVLIPILLYQVFSTEIFSQSRYYKPKTQQYQSTFVPVDIQALSSILERRQANYDNTQQYIDKLIKSIFELKANTDDLLFHSELDKVYKKLRLYDKKDLSLVPASELKAFEYQLLEEINKYIQRAKSQNETNMNAPKFNKVSTEFTIVERYSGNDKIELAFNGEIKEQPYINGIVIEEIPAGTKVKVLQKTNNGYYKVRLDDITGYISEVWIKKNRGEIKTTINEPNPKNDSKSLENAIRMLESGKYEDSYSAFCAIHKNSPNDMNALYYKGLLEMEYYGNYDESIRTFQKLVNLAPEVDHGYFLLGDAYYRSGNDIEAVKYFSTCLKMNPYNSDALFFRGWRRAELGDNRGAIIDYEKLLDQIQENPLERFEESMVYNNYGYTLFENGDNTKGLALVEKAIQLNDQNYYAWGSKGEILLSIGQYEDAVLSFSKSLIILEKTNAPKGFYYYHRGLAKIKINKMDEAYIDLYEALNEGYEDASILITKYFNKN